MSVQDQGLGLEQFAPFIIALLLYFIIPLFLLIFYITWLRPRLKNRGKQSAETTGTPTAATPQPAQPVAPSAPVYTPPPARKGEYRYTLSDGEPAHGVEVLAILRDSADDRLTLYLDGVAYRTLVDQPEVKKRFTALMKELAGVVAEPAPPRPKVEPPAAIMADFAPSVDDDDLPLPDLDGDLPSLDDLVDLPEAELPPLPPLRPLTPPVISETPPPPVSNRFDALPGDLPDYRALAQDDKLLQPRRFAGARKVDMPPVPELNIAASIEAYLQYKIDLTPEYQGRGIHVRSAPGGGVMIEADGKYYESVQDVADPVTRAFIQKAIDEWQDRQ